MSAPEGRGPADREQLVAELERLRKVNAALIERAEAADQDQDSDFAVFSGVVMLEDQVRSRTRELDDALRRLEETNRELRRSRAELQAIFDVLPNPLAVSEADDATLVGVSRSFADLFGLDPVDVLGRRARSDDLGLWPDDDVRSRFVAALEDGGGRVSDFPLTVIASDGGEVHLTVAGRLLEVDGRRLLVTELHDVTRATHDHRRLRTLAEHDALTGLPNRLLLLERLEDAAADARAGKGQLAVCYLDLDGFKDVNDEHGHGSGDAVLAEVAQRLAGVVRTSDTVGRLGGDEFAMLLVGISGAEECESVLERALAAVAAPMEVAGYEGTLSTSIGYTLVPDDDAPPAVLLDHADAALYAAKRSGRARAHRYTP